MDPALYTALIFICGFISGLSTMNFILDADGQVDYNRPFFNATLTLQGEIEEDEKLRMITGPGTCKSYIRADPPAQYVIGEVLDDSIDVDTFNRTYYYEPGALQAGEPFFFHISELDPEERNGTSYACTETVNHFGKQQEHVTAILPSMVEDDVWKHDNEMDGHKYRVDNDYQETKGHVYLLYDRHAGDGDGDGDRDVPKEFREE